MLNCIYIHIDDNTPHTAFNDIFIILCSVTSDYLQQNISNLFYFVRTEMVAEIPILLHHVFVWSLWGDILFTASDMQHNTSAMLAYIVPT